MRIARVWLVILGLFIGSVPVESHARVEASLRPDEYVVAEVDAKEGTMTLQSGDALKKLRIRPDTEVTINGDPGALKDVQPQMKVKVTLSEPGVAARVEATGITVKAPPGAASAAGNGASAAVAAPDEGKTISPLEGTTWTLEEGAKVTAKIKFMPGGTLLYTPTTGGGHWRQNWEVIGGTDVKLTTRKGKSSVLRFNPKMTEFVVVDGGAIGHPVAE